MLFEVDHCPGADFHLDHRLKAGYDIVFRSLAIKSIYLANLLFWGGLFESRLTLTQG